MYFINAFIYKCEMLENHCTSSMDVGESLIFISLTDVSMSNINAYTYRCEMLENHCTLFSLTQMLE